MMIFWKLITKLAKKKNKILESINFQEAPDSLPEKKLIKEQENLDGAEAIKYSLIWNKNLNANLTLSCNVTLKDLSEIQKCIGENKNYRHLNYFLNFWSLLDTSDIQGEEFARVIVQKLKDNKQMGLQPYPEVSMASRTPSSNLPQNKSL